MNAYPLVHIYPNSFRGAWENGRMTYETTVSPPLDHRDILSLNVHKARGQAAGDWTMMLSEQAYNRYAGRLVGNERVLIERVWPGQQAPEVLMVGLLRNPSESIQRAETGQETPSNGLAGYDAGRLFLMHEQYHQPYLGIDPQAQMYAAFSDCPVFGAGNYGGLSEDKGDPGFIIYALVDTLLFGGSNSKWWGIDAKASDGLRWAAFLNLDGVKMMKSFDPNVIWGYGIFTPGQLYGNLWTALQRVVVPTLQELWVESVRDLDGKAVARLNFRPIPFWCHDQTAIQSLPVKDILKLDFRQAQAVSLQRDPDERYNFYACIPTGMMMDSEIAYQYTDIEMTGEYKYQDGTSEEIRFKLPIRERWHEAIYGLRRLEVQTNSLAWEFGPFVPAAKASPAMIARAKEQMQAYRNAVQDTVRRLTLRLWDYYFAANEFYKGTVVFRNREGDWRRINTQITDMRTNRDYYVQDSRLSYRRGGGWTETYQLIRGIEQAHFFELLKERNQRYRDGSN